MAVNVCYGCGNLFHTDVPNVYCTRECKEKAHRRLAPKRSQPKLSVKGAASLRSIERRLYARGWQPGDPLTAAEQRDINECYALSEQVPLSVRGAYEAMADESARYNSYHKRMRKR